MAINWTGGLSGALGGAGTGATLGSIIPGLGTGIGAGLGGLAGLLAGLWGGGDEGGFQRAETFTPQENNILSLLLSGGLGQLQNPYQGFDEIAQNARMGFNQQTVPSLAERFTSLGSNAISSPAFASQLGQAGSGLEQALASLQSQYGMQNRQQALNQIQMGLQPAYAQSYYKKAQPGFGENILSGLLSSAPTLYQTKQIKNALKVLSAAK